jgi:hypothetical protein
MSRRSLPSAGLGCALAALSFAPATVVADGELAIMTLSVPAVPYHCFPLGSEVEVILSECCLQVPVLGYQAFLAFDPDVLAFVSGQYLSFDVFGLPVVPITVNGGEITLAAGINPWLGQQPTQQDADLARLTFQVIANGQTEIVFPEHYPPTSFSSASGRIIPTMNPTGVFHGSAACPTTLGDMDCDGDVDFDDINPFVLALSDPLSYWTTFPDCNWYNGDCDCDGDVDFDDINPFVACFSGPCNCE